MDYFQNLFEEVEPLYNKNNSYHNIDHVVELINQLDLLDITYDEYEILYTTICFHDVIYIPGKQDNEQKSAELFLEYKNSELLSQLNNDYQNIVYNAILSTSPNSYFDKSDKYQKHLMFHIIDMMHDLDYYYFKDYNTLKEADEKIKQEYLTFTSEKDFNEGRREFLNNLLNQDIYVSIYKEDSETAKKNILKLITEKYS
jgi:predicted metal-dependent HD superfamily phosphohydrolase